MTNAIPEIFEESKNKLRKNLAADEQDAVATASANKTESKGQKTIAFTLDKNGNYHYEVEQYGAGVTVHFTAWITDPDARYDIKLKSSDGGGGHWEGIGINQKCSGEIKTSFWRKTKITINLHATVKNKTGHVALDYSI